MSGILNLNNVALILLSALGISTGQLLLKLGALRIQAIQSWHDLAAAAFNVYLISGLFVLGASTLLWIYVLRTVPLSMAYPFMALVFLTVPFFAVFFLGETLTPWKLAGALLIILGVIISTR